MDTVLMEGWFTLSLVQQMINLVITKRTILKCMKEEILDQNGKQIKKSGHGLTEQQINDVIWAIKRPMMILKGSKSDSLAVMTDIKDNKGRHIFAFISINQDGATERVNMIASIYGRNNLDEYLEKCVQNGLVLAINTEKVDELRLSIGGHFSEATAPINFDCTIAYSIKSVKHMDVVEFVSDQPDFHEDAAYMQLGSRLYRQRFSSSL